MATVFKRGGKSNRSGWYYISYTDHDGKRKTRSSRTTDKATAERIANKLKTDAALHGMELLIQPKTNMQSMAVVRLPSM